MLFHESSILFIPFYFIVTKVKISGKKVSRLIVGSAVFGWLFSYIRPLIYSIVPFGYSRYFASNTTKFESLLVGVFYLFLLIIVTIWMSPKLRNAAVINDKVGTWMFIMNIMFFCIGFDLSAATRMAAVFGPYLILYIPRLIQNGYGSPKRQRNMVILLFVLSGAQYVLRISINNIGGTMPYCFVWNG